MLNPNGNLVTKVTNLASENGRFPGVRVTFSRISADKVSTAF